MKEKALAIGLIIAIVVIMPIIASLTWLALGGLAVYVLWNKKKIQGFITDLTEVITGEKK